MLKTARIFTPISTPKSGPEKSGGHPLVLIALFSALGMLVSMIAILMGFPGAWN